MIDVGLMAKSTPFLKPKQARLTSAKPEGTFFFRYSLRKLPAIPPQVISCKHLSQFTASAVLGESLLITRMLQPPVNTVISKMETETIHKSSKPRIPLCVNLDFPGKIFYNWSAIGLNMVVANMWKKKKKKSWDVAVRLSAVLL